MLLVKVLVPAKVCAAIVTIPDAVFDAEGIAATEIVADVPVILAVGPDPAPEVHAQVVGKVLVSVSTHGTLTTA
jgi:hypothetical protein